MEKMDIKIVDALNISLLDIHRCMDKHCRLVEAIMGREGDGNQQGPVDWICPAGSREAELREALKEAVDVIEESRKAFKSKKLEALRKKLTQVLITG